MAVDQANLLREEANSPHAVFHQFILLLGKCSSDCHFFFFEGSEDSAFYIGFALDRLAGRDYHEFICNGRQGVIKVNELCGRDGRAFERTLHFVDKDHCEFINPGENLPNRVFQTDFYSFESYLVCQQSFRRFWTERLRLPSNDERYISYSIAFEKMHQSFSKRMKFLMAIVLIGRGIENRPKAKLNLNNVKLEKVISMDLESGTVNWENHAGRSFLAASNITASGISIRGDAIRSVFRKYLRHHEPKRYIRGKYELWFFVKFLILVSREVSDRNKARSKGLPRATPGEIITHTSAIDSLCGLAPRPDALDNYYETSINSYK